MEDSRLSQILPNDIIQLLKRKSSRDPSSRFQAKLHVLLDFVTKNPATENQIGVAWVNDDEFRMNKRTLASVMGIKLNTLNVNLRDLKFQQQQHNKDGWTRWKCPGFTRSGFQITSPDHDPTIPKLRKSTPFKLPPTIYHGDAPFNLGFTNPESEIQFFQYTTNIWTEMGGRVGETLPSKHFINLAAERFKQQEQPLSNAIDVLKAIITPDNFNQEVIYYAQFARFMAQFGPERTLMLKIASLLMCSNNTGSWLVFGKSHNNDPCGFFDENEPNCLILKKGNVYSRVWNMPLIEPPRDYLFDEERNGYSSWDFYFEKHPVIDSTAMSMIF